MTQFNTEEILARINLCIEEKGWSKEEFYANSGITSASFSQWNTKRHAPTVKKLRQAADCLGVPVEYLITGNNKKTATPEGDGLSETQTKLIGIVKQMTEEQAAAFLASASLLVTHRKDQDD